MPHFAASDLVLQSLPMSHEKDSSLIWVNNMQFSGEACSWFLTSQHYFAFLQQRMGLGIGINCLLL